MSTIIRLLATLLIASASTTAFAITADNVAANKNVSLNGSFGVYGWGSGVIAAASTVTDGAFLGSQHQWDLGSVWWDTRAPNSLNNSIDIDLGGSFSISGFKVEADNNDTYRLEYFNGGNWHTAWDIPILSSWGMESRSANLSNDITASRLRFTATGGDGYYSVSEIQAFGVQAPVPEPESYAMLLAGLAIVGWAARKRQV